jgi:hypothetical protein
MQTIIGTDAEDFIRRTLKAKLPAKNGAYDP